MKSIFQKIRGLLGQDPGLGEKINVSEGNSRSISPMNPAEALPKEVSGPSQRIPSPLSPPRRWGRIRSYAEEEARHDLWVEGLSPWAVACAARDLAPRPRSRWQLFRERDRPPTAYEIWRVERHAALLRRLEKLGYPYPSSRR